MHRHGRVALSVIAFVLALSQTGIAAAQEALSMVPPEEAEDVGSLLHRADGLSCPMSNIFRTPAQVLEARIAAINAGDLDAVMCTYAPDAVVIMPSGIMAGTETIRPAFEQMFMMLGNAAPPLTTVNIYGEVVMTTFTYNGPIFSIPDGSDTYVIRWGYIRYHTVHDSIVFNQ